MAEHQASSNELQEEISSIQFSSFGFGCTSEIPVACQPSISVQQQRIEESMKNIETAKTDNFHDENSES